MNQLFSPIITGNSFLDRIQGNIVSAFNQLVGPFLGGQLLPNIAIGTGATVINHGLGRIPQIWVICDQQASATVWRTAWTSNSVTLIASADCTISLWVN